MKSLFSTPIDRTLIDQVSQEACQSDRKRMNHNFHQPEDIVQRFLNAIEPDSYIRPHRHINPDRDEIFLVLRGSGAVIVFDETGTIQHINLLNPILGYWGADIPGGLYHTIVSLETGSVFYEVKPGPYNPKADKGFSPWSPAENSSEKFAYLKQLKTKITDHINSLK